MHLHKDLQSTSLEYQNAVASTEPLFRIFFPTQIACLKSIENLDFNFSL